MLPSRPYYQIGNHSGELVHQSPGSTQPVTVDVVANPTVGFNDVLHTVARKKLVVLTAVLAGVGVGLLVSAVREPVYRARTSVQLQGMNDNYFLRDVSPVAPLLPNASAQNYLENEVKVLQSETLARRVADRLRSDPAAVQSQPAADAGLAGFFARRWKPESGTRTFTTRDVRRAFKIDTSLQSQVIEVYYDDPDPAVAAKAANFAVEEFMAMNSEARWQIVEDTAKALGRQTADLKAKVETASRALDDYAKRNGLVYAGNGQTTVGEDRMRQLEDSLAKAEADRMAKQSRYEAALASPADSLPDSLVTGPLRQYETELETLKRQLAEQRTLYTPEHYKIQGLEAKIGEIQTAIAAERKSVVGRLKTEYEASVGAERQLTEANGGQLKAVQAESAKELEYDVLKRELETTQHLYDSVLEKVRAAGVASALGGTNVRIIDKAFPPNIPYAPDIPLNTALGLAVGLIGGIALAVLRTRDDKFVHPGDAALVDMPELGVILSARDPGAIDLPRRRLLGLGAGNYELGLATWQQESSLFAESFRSTLASILFSSELRGGSGAAGKTGQNGVLVVTSMEPEDGKTTVVANLGVAFAETKRRVLLIDADLRRPKLHGIFNVCNDYGFSDLVQSPEPVSKLDFSKLARATEVPGLWLLPSGPGADGVSKLLYSEKLDELLAGFRKEFDLVLIDTPPLKYYPDARVLGQKGDGVVFVVRANRTSRDDVRTWRETLMHDQTPVVGTILNDCRIDSSHYRAYNHFYKRASTNA